MELKDICRVARENVSGVVTQEVFAKMIGTSQIAISLIENGVVDEEVFKSIKRIYLISKVISCFVGKKKKPLPSGNSEMAR